MSDVFSFRNFWRNTEPLFKHRVEISQIDGDLDIVKYAVGGVFPQWATKATSVPIAGGIEVKYAGGVTLGNLVIDFIEEQDFYVGKFFGKWMDKLTNDGKIYKFPDEYKGLVTVLVGRTLQVELHYGGVFPVSIGNAELSPKAAVMVRRIEFSVDSVNVKE